MSQPPIREQQDALLVDVSVKPRASRARLGPLRAGRVSVSVTAPPADGAANKAVIELFARSLKLPKGSVEIVRGAGSRQKTVRVRGAARGALEELLR